MLLTLYGKSILSDINFDTVLNPLRVFKLKMKHFNAYMIHGQKNGSSLKICVIYCTNSFEIVYMIICEEEKDICEYFGSRISRVKIRVIKI